MSIGRMVITGVLALIVLVAMAFGLEYGGLHWMKFFAPRYQNVQREVFEETKSYTHGKIQDLAKYYEEWQKAETQEDKEAIESLIKMQFAEFDASQIRPVKLRQFLIQVRGY